MGTGMVWTLARMFHGPASTAKQKTPECGPLRAWCGAALSVVLLLPLCAASSEIVPFERDFTVRVWRKEHGLPDDRVLSLLRDRNGFLWIGTRKGVSRFDGRHFKTWSRSTHDIFSSEECNALAEDREGVVWPARSKTGWFACCRVGFAPWPPRMVCPIPKPARWWKPRTARCGSAPMGARSKWAGTNPAF